MGNERADYLPKKGALVSRRLMPTFHLLKMLTTKRTFKTGFKIEAAGASGDKSWNILNHNPTCVLDVSRKAAVAHFRLLTRHDCFNLHLFRAGDADSPNRSLSDVSLLMTPEHLDVRSALNSLLITLLKSTGEDEHEWHK